jgi:hypothetical protein
MNLLQLTPAQLRQAANLKEKIIELEHELNSVLGAGPSAAPPSGSPKKVHWTQTPAGRARMAKQMARQWQLRRKAAA